MDTMTVTREEHERDRRINAAAFRCLGIADSVKRRGASALVLERALDDMRTVLMEATAPCEAAVDPTRG